MIDPGECLQVPVIMCTQCCLGRTGHTRVKHSRMDAATALTHVTTRDHRRRVRENRTALYEALHPESATAHRHVLIAGDEW